MKNMNDEALAAQEAKLRDHPLLRRFAESRRKMALDPHRPLYHFVSPESTMNDPNGLCYMRQSIGQACINSHDAPLTRWSGNFIARFWLRIAATPRCQVCCRGWTKASKEVPDELTRKRQTRRTTLA